MRAPTQAPLEAQPLDYRTAFEMAPVGLALSRQRLMIDCNRELLAMFGAQREQLIGQSFEILYPTADEFERTGRRIAAELDNACRQARRAASCSGATSAAVRWTQPTHTPRGSGPSRTCLPSARCNLC